MEAVSLTGATGIRRARNLGINLCPAHRALRRPSGNRYRARASSQVGARPFHRQLPATGEHALCPLSTGFEAATAARNNAAVRLFSCGWGGPQSSHSCKALRLSGPGAATRAGAQRFISSFLLRQTPFRHWRCGVRHSCFGDTRTDHLRFVFFFRCPLVVRPKLFKTSEKRFRLTFK